MTPPTCGAQRPGSVPGSFDWGLFTALGFTGSASALAATWAAAHFAGGVAGLVTPLAHAAISVASVAGAAAIIALVLYFALKPDGCIRPTPHGEPICFSGIVQSTTDLSSTAVAILAPFAMGPSGMFYVVVKSMYWPYVTKYAYWVQCNAIGAAMLLCIIKSKTACGAKIGSIVGAGVGAIPGVIGGYLAGVATAAALAAAGCSVTFIFYLLCLLVALLVAAIVAAATTYAGAAIGGWIGQAIASTGSDPVGDAWKSVVPGMIVTVQGNWIQDPGLGNNELYYTTDINRTGQFANGPNYTTANANDTAPADCPISPQPTQPPSTLSL